MTDGQGSAEDLALLTGPRAQGLLSAAVATAGGQLVSWRARQVDHRPGRSTTVSYAARVRWADGEREDTLAATIGGPAVTAADGLHPGVLRLNDGIRDVAVWRMPLDPGLPALAAALAPRAVAHLLAAYGVAGVDPQTVRLAVRAYRPGRRAVIEARAGAARLFLKVVRPHTVQALHRRHTALGSQGFPVPTSLGWTDDGLLVLAALPGESMRVRMLDGGRLPTGADLLGLLDRLPAQLDLPHRPSWTSAAAHYARVVGAAVPDQAERAAALAARITAGTAQPPDRLVHGDLYEAQLLLTGAEITGVLDVDSAGPGRRADDLACLVAHALVLGLSRPEQAPRLHAVAAGWHADFRRRVDPVELDLRVAGVLLSLATGPHRVQEAGWPDGTRRRVDLVQDWVERAGTPR